MHGSLRPATNSDKLSDAFIAIVLGRCPSVTDFSDLISQLVGVMKKGLHKVFRLAGWILVLSVLQVFLHNLCKSWIFQEPVAKAIGRGREA